jgi:surfeit locus 1 family protein
MKSKSRVPSDLLLFALIALAASAGFVRLGIWQLERHRDVRDENTDRAARLALAPMRLDAPMLAAAETDSLLWRRVEVTGRWVVEHAAVIRNRVRAGTPGVHLVTPLRLGSPQGETGGGGASVLVLRGWLPSPDAAAAHRQTEASGPGIDGRVSKLALVRESRAGRGDPMVELETDSGRIRSFAAIDVELIADGSEQTAPFFLQLLPADGDDLDDSGGPLAVPLPDLDGRPHMGYAIQWFSFALVTLIGSIAFLRRETGQDT